MNIETAHMLAHYIEWQHAKDRARERRVRTDPENIFDPLAATCLGDLIYHVATTGTFK
jgi:hypothetical protein